MEISTGNATDAHREHTACAERLESLNRALSKACKHLSTDVLSTIYKHCIKKSFNSFSIYYFLHLTCWLEIDLAPRLLYNRRSLKRGPFRPATDHQVTHHETHFPTQHPQARSHPRFPCSYGHQERPRRTVASSRQRS